MYKKYYFIFSLLFSININSESLESISENISKSSGQKVEDIKTIFSGLSVEELILAKEIYFHLQLKGKQITLKEIGIIKETIQKNKIGISKIPAGYFD